MTSAPPPSTPPKKRRLGEILIDAGVLTDVQLKSALGEQRKWGGKLGRTLIEMGFVDEQTMVLALSRQLHVPSVDLEKANITPEVLSLIVRDTAERYSVFPIGGDKRQRFVHIATSEPGNMDMLQELSFLLGLRVQVSVASEKAIERAIRRHYYGEEPEPRDVMGSTPAPIPPTTEFELTTGFSTQAPAPAPVKIDLFAEGTSDDFGLNDILNKPKDELGEVLQKVKALTDQVAALENRLGAQSKAIRCIVELLLEKRAFSRDEYLQKMKAPTPPK